LYLLDGGTHFHHATGIVQFLSAQGLIPEMIVVAVQNVDRTRDFSPTKVPERPTTGGAEKFMAYLENELIPFINKNYRAVSYDILMGHSFGGEFAAYALLNRPEVFDAYIAISPYMMYDNSVMIEETKAKLKSDYKNEIQFYMTVGNEPDYFPTLSEFENIVKKKSPKNFKLSYTKFENDNHGSVPHLSIYYGLESIYSGWKLPKEVYLSGLAAIDNHFKNISKKYGYKVETPEGTINQLGYYYLNKNDRAQAIQVFTENVKRYPLSANVYDSLGEAYENNDQFTEASENYQKACELAKATNHPNLGIYEDNLKRAQLKLAQN
jgi:predicted alpha/beta superfamily hydrolase